MMTISLIPSSNSVTEGNTMSKRRFPRRMLFLPRNQVKEPGNPDLRTSLPPQSARKSALLMTSTAVGLRPKISPLCRRRTSHYNVRHRPPCRLRPHNPTSHPRKSRECSSTSGQTDWNRTAMRTHRTVLIKAHFPPVEAQIRLMPCLPPQNSKACGTTTMSKFCINTPALVPATITLNEGRTTAIIGLGTESPSEETACRTRLQIPGDRKTSTVHTEFHPRRKASRMLRHKTAEDGDCRTWVHHPPRSATDRVTVEDNSLRTCPRCLPRRQASGARLRGSTTLCPHSGRRRSHHRRCGRVRRLIPVPLLPH
jgi:hypothetical protein